MDDYHAEKVTDDHVSDNAEADKSRYSSDGRRISVQDDVFGDIKEGGPNYRNVGWIGTAILMMKTQIGLGVLAIPVVLDKLGMVPGIVSLLWVAAISTWTNYEIGQFKLKHRSVYGIDDMGFKALGPVGREFFALAYLLFWIFVAGSGMLGISIALNAVSSHGACTAIFVAVAAIVGFMLSSIQTLGKISILAWIGLVGILTAILTVTIGVGLQDRPAEYTGPDPFVSDYTISKEPTILEFFVAVSQLIFAFAGTPAFFAIVSEMKNPKLYTKSMFTCQTVVTITYTTIGIVVYYYCGSYVSAPALGSAGDLIKKIAYGFALPGLIVTTTLCLHLPAKYIFVRLLRGTPALTDNSIKHWVIWISCTLGNTIIAYLIASAIPVFGELVALIGALLGTLMSFHPGPIMWLHDNWKTPRITKWFLMVGWSIFVLVVGTFLLVGGTYASVIGIKDAYAASGGSAAWSCADNSIGASGGH